MSWLLKKHDIAHLSTWSVQERQTHGRERTTKKTRQSFFFFFVFYLRKGRQKKFHEHNTNGPSSVPRLIELPKIPLISTWASGKERLSSPRSLPPPPPNPPARIRLLTFLWLWHTLWNRKYILSFHSWNLPLLHKHSNLVISQWQNWFGAQQKGGNLLPTHAVLTKALDLLEFSNSSTVLTLWWDKNKKSAWHAMSQG